MVNLLLKNGKNIKCKKFWGERELRGRTEEKGKEQLGFGWKKKTKQNTSLCVI